MHLSRRSAFCLIRKNFFTGSALRFNRSQMFKCVSNNDEKIILPRKNNEIQIEIKKKLQLINQPKISMKIFRLGYQLNSFFLMNLDHGHDLITEVGEFHQMTTGLKVKFNKSLLHSRDFTIFLDFIHYPTVLENIHQFDSHRHSHQYKLNFNSNGRVEIESIKQLTLSYFPKY